MKRRVPAEDRRREPRQLKRGAEARGEHGLGAAGSSLRRGVGFAGCARHRAGVTHSPRPCPRGPGEPRWYHGSFVVLAQFKGDFLICTAFPGSSDPQTRQEGVRSVAEPIIQIQHLNKTFGEGPTAVHALDDINLEIMAGEIFGIIGLSGAGKSTLVRCMNLLERPTAGTVLFNGQDITKFKTKELRDARHAISMIFQSFNLLMQRTALDNICFPLELIGVKRAEAVKKARELLKIVGLEDKEKAYPAQMSGGQKQRVAIARALATDPKVLLCDEATSALDPNTTLSILALLQELNQKLGVTVVVITHQMNVIEEICHRVAILDGGVVAEQGAVADIFADPKTDIGRQLVYPNGVRIDKLPPAHVIRVAFNGGSSYEPLIASLAIDLGIKANILGADTRNIDGKAFGTMLLGLPESQAEAARAIEYIRSQPNVTVEEVPDHG